MVADLFSEPGAGATGPGRTAAGSEAQRPARKLGSTAADLFSEPGAGATGPGRTAAGSEARRLARMAQRASIAGE